MLQNSCALIFFTPLQSLTIKKTSQRYLSEHTDKKHFGICSLLLSSLLHHFLPFASFTLSPVCLQESWWFPSYTVSSCAKWICLPLTRLFNILSPLCFVSFSLFSQLPQLSPPCFLIVHLHYAPPHFLLHHSPRWQRPLWQSAWVQARFLSRQSTSACLHCEQGEICSIVPVPALAALPPCGSGLNAGSLTNQ